MKPLFLTLFFALLLGASACGGNATVTPRPNGITLTLVTDGSSSLSTPPAPTQSPKKTSPTVVTAASSSTATRPSVTRRSTTSTRPPATRRPITPTRPAQINGFDAIALSELPAQALDTLDLINRGGPFPYRQDGVIFQNRERLLPAKPNGYYHEYTVKTPGSNDRGARRIIAGDGGELYYTDDHYDSFKVIIDDE